jgi:hyaluronoglucosaminidase
MARPQRTHRTWRRSFAGILGAALAAALLAPTPFASDAVAKPARSVRPILPQPQDAQPRASSVRLDGEVTIIAGEAVDRPALHALQALLDEYDLRTRVRREPVTGSHQPMVVLGGPTETPASVEALKALGVPGPEGLPAEGYVLVTGRDDHGRARIVLSGVDGAGTFYAVQSLRQLMAALAHGARVDGVEIRDWPAYGIRGGMESFYGPVWSQEDRRSQIEFLARHKMNQFFYGPADDLRTGSDWDLPYEPAELSRLKEVVDLARDRHVDFVYRVSPEAPMAPSQGICHARESDREKLLARFEQLWEIGVRSFVIAWDDVPGNFVCEADQVAYGDDVPPLAAAQADVTNFVQREFIETHPGASRLVTVPTEYWGMERTTYRDRFDEVLSTEVDIYWTGPAVVSPAITVDDLAAVKKAFPRHRIMIWDNYPVNDYTPNRLLLGPLVNREPALASHVIGISFNELVRDQQVSQIPLGTQADYAWNPHAYEPERSWTQTLRLLGGDAYEELRLFAENNRVSLLDTTERPDLAAAIDELLAAYTEGRPVTRQLGRLDDELRLLENLPTSLRDKLDDQLMLWQIGPWLDRIGVTGQAGRAALDILRSQDDGHGEAAWRARRAQARLRGILDQTWHQISPGPIDRLLNFAAQQSDGYLGVRWYGDLGEPSGTPAAADGSSLANLTDRRVDTAYVAGGRPEPGDAVTMPITKQHRLASVTVVQDADAPAKATIQARVGDTWVDLGPLSGGFTTVPANGLTASAIRLRWAKNSNPPRVYEIIPKYADVLGGRVRLDPPGALIESGTTKRFQVAFEVFDDDTFSGDVTVTGPDGWIVDPAKQRVRIRPDGRTVIARVPLDVTVPDDTPNGRYDIQVTVRDDAATVEVTGAVLVGEGTYPELVGVAGPVGYWRLGDPADSQVAVDSSPTGQDGVYRDGARPGAPGAIANDTAADLATGYVEVPRTPATDLSGPFTLEAWVKLDTVAPPPGQAIIESYTAPAANGFALRVDNGVLQAWTLGGPGDGYGVVTGRTRLTIGEWHHVAAVYDGSRLTVYLDGTPDSSVATTISPASGTSSIKLGARGDDTAQRLRGDLDEAAIYGRALSADEIERHYLAGVG